MQNNLLLRHLQKEIIEEYFEICQYFIVTKNFGRQEDRIRVNFYKSLLLADPLPTVYHKNKLDLEIISSALSVKSKLIDTYTSEFIVSIIHSGIRMFFDKMERYAAIDVHLRSIPDLFSFFNDMTPVIQNTLEEFVETEFSLAKKQTQTSASSFEFFAKEINASLVN